MSDPATVKAARLLLHQLGVTVEDLLWTPVAVPTIAGYLPTVVAAAGPEPAPPRYGDVDVDIDTIVWAYTGGGLRQITLPYLVFGEPIPELATAAGQSRPLHSQPMLMDGADV